MRFPYYARLTRPEQEIYRRSDALTDVPLPHAPALRALVAPIGTALAADDRRATEAATDVLVQAVLVDLGAPGVVVKVLAKRPREADGGELHGLYMAEDGQPPVLRVWMRTAAKKQPVKLRTFVRTVVHEVVHHLDFTIHDLAPSFHCEGFFKREAHVSRQLLDDPRERLLGPSAPVALVARVAPEPADADGDVPPQMRQLALFDE